MAAQKTKDYCMSDFRYDEKRQEYKCRICPVSNPKDGWCDLKHLAGHAGSGRHRTALRQREIQAAHKRASTGVPVNVKEQPSVPSGPSRQTGRTGEGNVQDEGAPDEAGHVPARTCREFSPDAFLDDLPDLPDATDFSRLGWTDSTGRRVIFSAETAANEELPEREDVEDSDPLFRSEDSEEPEITAEELNSRLFGPSADSDWFPYPDKAMFLTDVLFSSPRLRFSRAQQKAVLSWAKDLGANIPSYDCFRKTQGALLAEIGDPTVRQESGRGTVWYMNEIGDSIEKDMANPFTREGMVFYPEDGGVMYYVNELVKRSQNRWFLPKRWITRGAGSIMMASGYHVRDSEDGLLVDNTSLDVVDVSSFDANFLQILEETSGIFPLAPQSVDFAEEMPHPLRAIADPVVAWDCEKHEEVLLQPYGLLFAGDNTTDADGGSKGRSNLGKKRPWLILPSCWAHQFQLILGDYFRVYDGAAVIAEDAHTLIAWINNHGRVHMIFDESQRIISKDRNAGIIIVLAYLVANLTRWTTHFIAFRRLFILRQALQLAVLQKRTAIIDAEVGAATSTEGERLREDAERMCALIEDASFWSGLEVVLGDLEPICLGTNINQKDSTRLDQVLLTIAGIFLRFSDHPEVEVRTAMLARLEKRWKDCDQLVFLLALILNPFEKLSCFGPNAQINQIKCHNMLLLLYQRINDRPDNEDTPEQRKAKELQVSRAFMRYLAGTGDFVDFDAEEWEQISGDTDPIHVWEAFADGGDVAELARFAIIILNIVANQAGCERTFSRTKVEQSDHRNRLGLEKTDKRTKVRAQIRSEHEKQGLIKPRHGRKNHTSTATLLAVPRYRDLLEDQEDEDSTEHGRLLVTSPHGWRTEVAKWISDARAAERAEREAGNDDEEIDEAFPRIPTRLPPWKPMTLEALFGGAEKPRKRKPSARAMEEEERLMEELANAEEDSVPDDGAIEIDSDDEYGA
ncbi:ribonuclease H-like domain-containing protein [Mycena crocata]|nr:ribonuclease H-like domain-containing protein [Mycena crocata]